MKLFQQKVGRKISLSFFTSCFVAFGGIYYYQSDQIWYWVPCVCRSLYHFMLTLLKLYMCFCHDLKMFMWFLYTQRQWKATSKSHTLNIGQYLANSERILQHSILWHRVPCITSMETVSVTPKCIIIIPWWTPVVSIALYRKMLSIGATSKFDPHFSRLMG